MDDELICQAGEFVLGTLSPAEHDMFLLRIAREPAAAEAVQMWSARLAPLASGANEMPPPSHLWPGILERIAAAPRAANDNRVSGWWRGATFASSLLALVLAGLALRPQAPVETVSVPVAVPVPGTPKTVEVPARPGPSGPSYVAALAEEGAQPALLVTLDPKTGRAVIRALGLTAPARKSLQLWYIGGGRGPESLGLVSGDEQVARVLTQALRSGDAFDQAQFAVSVEPEGGSPGPAPTGDIIYTGKLVQVGGAS